MARLRSESATPEYLRDPVPDTLLADAGRVDTALQRMYPAVEAVNSLYEQVHADVSSPRAVLPGEQLDVVRIPEITATHVRDRLITAAQGLEGEYKLEISMHAAALTALTMQRFRRSIVRPGIRETVRILASPSTGHAWAQLEDPRQGGIPNPLIVDPLGFDRQLSVVQHLLPLPHRDGRTSPTPADDVARSIARRYANHPTFGYTFGN